MNNIMYEDNHIIVVYKPSGVLSQGDGSSKKDMLSMIKEYLVAKYNKPGEAYLGLVHRLDTNTSGVMVFAKTSKAASRLNEEIKKNRFDKRYLAVINVNISSKLKESATLKDYLCKNEKEKKSYVTTKEKGKVALLEYKIQEDYKNYALVNIKLHTGRHHQIRVQFANIGCPLYGDVKYGAKKNDEFYLALQAYSLSFYHPTTKKLLTFKKIAKTNIFKNFKSI